MCFNSILVPFFLLLDKQILFPFLIQALSMQNKEQARQILLACPNLPKAIFQVLKYLLLQICVEVVFFFFFCLLMFFIAAVDHISCLVFWGVRHILNFNIFGFSFIDVIRWFCSFPSKLMFQKEMGKIKSHWFH